MTKKTRRQRTRTPVKVTVSADPQLIEKLLFYAILALIAIVGILSGYPSIADSILKILLR